MEFTIEFQLLSFSKKKVDQFALIEMSQVYFLKFQPVDHLFIFFNVVNQIFKLYVSLSKNKNVYF